MIFSTAAAAPVLEHYERRIDEERAVAAQLGRAMPSRRDEFLLSVGPEVGGFLHSLILARRPARVLELGTSYGYSTLFMADAVKQIGGTLVTMEIADYKQTYARSMIARAGLDACVDFRLGDAVSMIAADTGTFDFVLLDIWKDLYLPCLEAVFPKLSDEGLIAADNMIDPPMWRDSVREYRAAVKAFGCQSILLPIGSGIELSIKWAPGNPKL